MSIDRREFLSRTARTAVALSVLRHASACRPAARDGDAHFTTLRERYFLKSLELNPVISTYLGGDGYSPRLAGANGRLRDYSEGALADEIRFYREVELGAFVATTLNAPDRIDHAVLGAQVRYLLHQLDERRYQERCLDTYVAEPFRGVDWQLQQMQALEGGLLGTQSEWADVVRRLQAVPRYLEVARANLLKGKASGNLADRRMVERDGIQGSRANVEYFRKTLPETAERYLGTQSFAPAMAARLVQAGTRAADAYAGFAAFLEQRFDLDKQTDRFAVGEREYEWRVHNCLQDARSAAELYEYGAAEVARYEEQAFAVAEEVARAAGLRVGFSTSAERRPAVRAVLDHLSQDAPRDDDELFRWYREVGERAVAYGRERNLFDIPAEYRLDVVPTPPVLRSTIEAAYYPAPPFKKSGVGRFYLTPTDNDPAKLKLNNRSSVADTAVHEGFPGHDWHYKYMTEHAAEISNIRWLTPGAVEDSFSMWEDSPPTEGWALYSEELMAEPAPQRPHGFYTAAEHLYELIWQLRRAVRVRVDVGIHTERMSFDEAVDYFTEHVDFYPRACATAARDSLARATCANARRELYRYSKWPTQAITYNLGKNAIVKLRDDYRAQLASRYSAKEFHERFMRMGTIPVGYYRESFLAT